MWFSLELSLLFLLLLFWEHLGNLEKWFSQVMEKLFDIF